MSSSVAPNPKLDALASSIKALTELQNGIKTDKIESSAVLADKFNALAVSLATLHQAGRAMDNTLLLEIPYEMLEFLTEDVSNPEMYQHEAIKQYENKAELMSNRLRYLQELKSEVEKKPSV